MSERRSRRAASPAADSEALVTQLNRGVRRAQQKLTHVEDVPFGPALTVSRWRLGNGLSVLLLPDPSAPIVAYHTWYRVGSRFEEQGKTGLAHFFEHMMFNETKNLPWGEFDQRMEAVGAETNAATYIDWTYYHETLPAEDVGLAIELESDRMQNLVVKKKQVESEREVVANERRMAVEDDVHGAADERLHALAYGETHPHGWPVIGWMRDIEGYRVADCKAFYDTWYAPNNATLVIVGSFELRAVLEGVRDAYGRMAPSKLPARPKPPAPRQRSERRAEIRWPTPTPKCIVGWHAPAYASFEHAVVEVIDEILTGGRSGRLRRRLVEDMEIVSSIGGGVAALRYGGLFDLFIQMREGHQVGEALSVVDEEIGRLVDEPVAARELEKVKARAELFALGSIETCNGKAGQIGFNETVAENPAYGFHRLEELKRVGADDVQRVAKKILASARRSIVSVLPEEAAA